MSNPGRTALISAVAVALIGASILSSDEAPGTALAVLRYALLAMAFVGLVGSLVRIGR